MPLGAMFLFILVATTVLMGAVIFASSMGWVDLAMTEFDRLALVVMADVVTGLYILVLVGLPISVVVARAILDHRHRRSGWKVDPRFL